MAHVDVEGGKLEGELEEPRPVEEEGTVVMVQHLKKPSYGENLLDLNPMLAELTRGDLLLREPPDQTLLVNIGHGTAAETRIYEDIVLVLCQKADAALL